jgi:hypothetical protein
MRPTTLARTWMLGIAAGLASFTGLAGCSQNKHVFKSTPELPTTVQVTDALSGNVIWAMDVPVNEELSLDFDRSYNVELFKNAHEPPNSMTWKLFHIRSGWQVAPYKFGRVRLDGVRAMMKVTYRPTPEYPPGYTPPGVPASEYGTATQAATSPEETQSDNMSPTPATAEPAPAMPATEVTPAENAPAAPPSSEPAASPEKIETAPAPAVPDPKLDL